MSGFDLGVIADRFRRAGERPLVAPPVAPHGGGLQSNTSDPASEAAGVGSPAPGPLPPPGPAARLVPEGPTSRRRPRRRRWTVPTSPTERRQPPIDPPPAELHRCRFCGQRHQPVPMPTRTGLAAYAEPIAAASWETSARPRPVGLTATQQANLIRDQHNAWRMNQAAEPIPPGSMTVRERLVYLWQGDDAAP